MDSLVVHLLPWYLRIGASLLIPSVHQTFKIYILCSLNMSAQQLSQAQISLYILLNKGTCLACHRGYVDDGLSIRSNYLNTLLCNFYLRYGFSPPHLWVFAQFPKLIRIFSLLLLYFLNQNIITLFTNSVLAWVTSFAWPKIDSGLPSKLFFVSDPNPDLVFYLGLGQLCKIARLTLQPQISHRVICGFTFFLYSP